MRQPPPLSSLRDPLVVLGSGVVLGVWTWPHLEPAAWQAGAGLLVCAGLAWWWGERAWIAVFGAALCLGWMRPGLAEPGPVLEGHAALRGRVVASSGTRARVEVDGLDGQPAHGQVLLRFPERAPGPGLRVAAFGRARPSWEVVLPGELDPELEARTVGVRSSLIVQDWLPLRPVAEASRPFELAEHEGLLEGLALGRRERVPEATRELLQRTGTQHLLAVSGLHVGLVGGLAAALAGWLARPLVVIRRERLARALPVLVGVVIGLAFAWSVGWPLSSRRACWMLGGALLGSATGRGARPWSLLGAAATAIALGDPAAPRSLSFLLSFGAVIGMLQLTPRIERLIPPDSSRLILWPVRSLGATLGATLGTLPVVAWVFQDLSVSAPLANLVAVPLLGGVALPSALLARSGWLAPLALADGAADLALRALELLAGAPTVHPAVGPLGAALLFLAVLLVRRPRLAVLLTLGSLLSSGGASRRPEGLQVTFLAIGQGDAALVELGGRRVLIDGGPPSARLLLWLRREGIRRLDEVVITHPHPDHSGGVEAVLEELSVDVLRVPRGPLADEEHFRRLWDLAGERGVHRVGSAGPTLPGFEVLHPWSTFLEEHGDEANEISLVIRVQHGAHSLLFAGDIEDRAEAALAPVLEPVTVLKVPHHGSRTSSSPALLAALHPQLAVFSCGRESRFGHPHAEVLERYLGVGILRTDQLGTVQLRSDGETLTLRSWLPGRGWTPWRASTARPSPRGPPALAGR
jgi:competence protein ComEC